MRGKVREEEGTGNGAGCSPDGDHACHILCLKAFISLLQAGILREAAGEGFSRIFISSPGVPFRVMVSIDWSAPGQGSLVIAAGPGIAHLVLLLFWACS